MKSRKIYKFQVRLSGIDAPERRGGNDEETEIALKAQEALCSKILGKDVYLENIRLEKYGRLLCVVRLPGQREDISQWLLRSRYAVPYEGGKKDPPTSWRNYHENNIL